MSDIEAQPGIVSSGSHFTNAINLLSRRAGRAQRVAQALIVGAAIYEVSNKAFKRAETELSYTVSIPSADDVYADVHAWLLERIPSRKRKALTARSGRTNRGGDIAEPVGGTSRRTMLAALHLFYDGSTTQTVNIDGHRIKVRVDKDERNMRNLSADEMRQWWVDPERIIFTCKGDKARDAVLAFVTTIAQSKVEQSSTRFYIADKWGNWNRRNDLAKRPIDTVILRAGQRERIIADLAEFLNAEQRYARRFNCVNDVRITTGSDRFQEVHVMFPAARVELVYLDGNGDELAPWRWRVHRRWARWCRRIRLIRAVLLMFQRTN